MKLMIASDVHGSAHFGRLLLDALQGVPGAMPPSGYPTLSSYSQPQTVHTYFIVILPFFF